MAVGFPRVLRTSILTKKLASRSLEVPNGFLAVYVVETKKKRFLVPVSYSNQPSFQDFLNKAEEEYGYDHIMGGLTISCSEDDFIDVISNLCR